MKPSDVALVAEASLKAGLTVLIVGPPGVGKTDVSKQVGGKIGYDSIIEFPVATSDPLELRGMPFINKETGRTSYALGGMWPDKGAHLILLDDYTGAPPALQAALYPLIHRKTLNGNEYALPPGCGVIATGNRMVDRAVVHRTSTATGSRVHWVDYDVDAEDWNRWAVANGIHLDVVFYMKLRHYAFLHQFDPTKNERTFPCPRTWEAVSNLHYIGLPERLRYEAYSGLVESAAAADFCGFLKIKDHIQNPDVIMMKPGSVDIPEQPDVLFATAAAIAARAKKDNIDRVIQYAERLPEEFSTFLVVTAITRDKKLAATRPFQEWAAAHPNAVN